MPAFLFAWNPKKYDWDTLSEDIRELRERGQLHDLWTVGNSKQLHAGDRFFLIRLGARPKGIVGSGYITSERYLSPHYEPQRAARGDMSWKININFDKLVEPSSCLPYSMLQSGFLAEMHWAIRSSGIRIPDHIAAELEKLWSVY